MESLEKKISLVHKPVLTRDQFLASYLHHGRAENGVAVLDHYRVFNTAGNLMYTNKKFSLITLLGLYTHFSGDLSIVHLRDDYYPICFQATIINRRPKKCSLFDMWQEQLGMRFTKETSSGKSSSYHFGANGSTYARLLFLLGYSTSLAPSREQRNTKTQRGAQLPIYLTKLIEKYDSFDEESQNIAQQCLRDLITVFFDTRASIPASRSSVRLGLIAQHTPAKLSLQARQLIRAMNCVYPELHASIRDNLTIVRGDKQQEKYVGYITLSRDQIWNALEHSSFFPVRFRLTLSPRFLYHSWNKKARMLR